MKRALYTFLIGFLFYACETEVNPDLDSPLNILVIDAWLTDNDPVQQINITRSQSYFDNSPPSKVEGALVTVTDLTDGTIYTFNETAERYEWTSGNGSTLGQIGHRYELRVELNGRTYTATTTVGRVPPVDSVRFISLDVPFDDPLILAEFFAVDLEGLDDTYWIKAWKNGRYLGQPSEINIAYDAVFQRNENNDGVNFIQPIRLGINPIDDEGEEFVEYQLPLDTLVIQTDTVNNDSIFLPDSDRDFYGLLLNNDSEDTDTIVFANEFRPEGLDFVLTENPKYKLLGDTALFVDGDSVYVEIHSVSNEAYFFLEQVSIETNREGGFGALFATPLANVSTNIEPENESELVAGFFNIAAVSSGANKLTNEGQIRIIE